MIAVTASDLFPQPTRKAVLVRLPTFEWDFTLGLGVRLEAGQHTIDARQVGTGNHEGRATVMLAPTDWATAESELKAMLAFAGPILLKKRG
jgi:hypothetical protein